MNNKRFRNTLLLSGALLTVLACSFITIGSGDVINETRQVADFERIHLNGQGVVIVTQSGAESVSIESNANILELVEVEVVNGTLELGLEEGTNIISNARLLFHVGVDDLSGLSIAGSGEIESHRIETDHLKVTVGGSGGVEIDDISAGDVEASLAGSGKIDLAGDAASQDISIAGSGKYMAGDLCSGLVRVSIGGSGKATVCATETLDISLDGSGSVDYFGNPRINSSGSGSGQINNLDE